MGTLSGYRPTKLANCLENKLGISFGDGSDLTGWYWLDGKKLLRVTVPKGHSGDVSPGVVKKTFGALRLNSKELRLLYNCPMTGSDYEQKIRNLFTLNKV